MKKIYFKFRCVLLSVIFVSVFSKAEAQPFGGFMSFDGVDDELQVSGYPIPANSDFTIEFWFRSCRDTTAPFHDMVLENADLMNIDFYSPITGTTIYQLCAQYDAVNQVCHQELQYPPDSQWHHFAATYNLALDEFDIYYDGIDAVLGPGYNYSFFPDPTITIGVSTFEPWLYNHFQGYMDELRISNNIRYSGTFTPPTNPFTTDANTVGLWHFEEVNPITSVLDASGNGFNFTPSGNPKIIHLDNMIGQTGNVLTVSDPYDSYQWIDCSTGLPIPGETSQSYTVTTNGDYAVQVSNTDCAITSDCISVTAELVGESQNNPDIFISSNSATNILTIDKKENIEIQIEIFECTGKLIFSQKTDQSITSIDLNGFAPGIYIVKVNTKEKFFVKKIVKN